MIEATQAIQQRMHTLFPKHKTLLHYPEKPVSQSISILFREKSTKPETSAHDVVQYTYEIIGIHERSDEVYRMFEQMAWSFSRDPYLRQADQPALFAENFTYGANTILPVQQYGLSGTLRLVCRQIRKPITPAPPVKRVTITISARRNLHE